MATLKTVQSGSWHNSAIWDLGRVPTVGDRAEVNHLVYAEQKVVVGDGSLNALVLNAPLVCFDDLSVIGRVRSNSTTAGLFFLKQTLDWVFYASEGFHIPPMSQEALTDLWESVFGSSPPEGYLIPIAGTINTETVFMPNQHPISDPLKNRLAGIVLNIHLKPADPRSKMTAYVSPLDQFGLVSPSDLLNTINTIKAIKASATDINADYDIEVNLLTDWVMFVWLWAKMLIGDATVKVTETETDFNIIVAQPSDLSDATLTITTLMQGLTPVQTLLNELGVGKQLKITLV